MLLGWIGSVLLIVGAVVIGNKSREAFLWTIAGEIIWLIEGTRMNRVDIVVLSVVFLVINARNWFLWK